MYAIGPSSLTASVQIAETYLASKLLADEVRAFQSMHINYDAANWGSVAANIFCHWIDIDLYRGRTFGKLRRGGIVHN